MAWSITIAGVEMVGTAHKLAQEDVVYTDALGQRSTLNFSVLSDDGSYSPAIGAAVLAVNAALGVEFGGTIQQRDTEAPGYSVLIHKLGCASREQMFDRLTCESKTYTNYTAGAIMEDLLKTYAGSEGLGTYALENGPVIAEYVTNYETLREHFDKLCEISTSATDTYAWDCPTISGAITPRFFKQDTYPAPFDIEEPDTDGAMLRPVTVKEDLTDYCNSVYVRMGNYIRSAEMQEFTGDGSNQIFSCTYPLKSAPSVAIVTEYADTAEETPDATEMDGMNTHAFMLHAVVSVVSITLEGVAQTFDTTAGPGVDWVYTVGSDNIVQQVPTAGTAVFTYTYATGTYTRALPVAQTVGISGDVDGKQFHWAAGSREVVQADGQTPPTGHQFVQVTYEGTQERVLGPYQDAAGIAARAAAEGGTGVYQMIITSDVSGSEEAAAALGQAWLDKHSKIPKTVEYPTGTSGLRAGQYQAIESTRLGIDDTFILESVTLSYSDDWRWQVRAVNGPLLGDWMKKLRESFGGGGSDAGTLLGGVAAAKKKALTPDQNDVINASVLNVHSYRDKDGVPLWDMTFAFTLKDTASTSYVNYTVQWYSVSTGLFTNVEQLNGSNRLEGRHLITVRGWGVLDDTKFRMRLYADGYHLADYIEEGIPDASWLLCACWLGSGTTTTFSDGSTAAVAADGTYVDVTPAVPTGYLKPPISGPIKRNLDGSLDLSTGAGLTVLDNDLIAAVDGASIYTAVDGSLTVAYDGQTIDLGAEGIYVKEIATDLLVAGAALISAALIESLEVSQITGWEGATIDVGSGMTIDGGVEILGTLTLGDYLYASTIWGAGLSDLVEFPGNDGVSIPYGPLAADSISEGGVSLETKYAQSSALADVAFSGDYGDLSNTPSGSTMNVNYIWDVGQPAATLHFVNGLFTGIN